MIAKAHRLIGVLFLVVFVLTGRYMDMRLAHLRGMADGPRALYRSGHIYILFAALLNILIGLYLHRPGGSAARIAQLAASVLLIAAPFMFTYGFFVETPPAIIERPVIRLAIYTCLWGTLIHAATSLAEPEARDAVAVE
jgi:hypothetical protein